MDEVSAKSKQLLVAAERGAKCLSLVPAPWNERLKPLLREPQLQLESLIMVQQFKAAAELLQAVPEMHDDDMLLHYARYCASSSYPQNSAA